MTAITIPAVTKSVTVEVPVERAFEVFTGRMGTWWPLESHHIGEQVAETAVMEPRAGGRWFERAADGTECEWGRVLAWEPPTRVVLAWHLNARWAYDPDEEHSSEIDVRFTADGPGRTRVELEHRGLERHGADADAIREAISSEGGWTGLLAAFKAAADAA
jgi:uncharacterized protein YndB with AHSA1/START domain